MDNIDYGYCKACGEPKPPEMADEMPYDDPDIIIISKKDLQFLLDEYREAQRGVIGSHYFENPQSHSLYKGMKRELETALIRMGVSNDELDSICHEVHQNFLKENKYRNEVGE